MNEKKIQKLLHENVVIQDGSDKVCSSWTVTQVDYWKHLSSDKYSAIYFMGFRPILLVQNLDKNIMVAVIKRNEH